MILQALYQYYMTLCDRGELSPPGWDDAFKVSFGLELDDEGNLIDLIDFRQEQIRGKKTVIVPQVMRVPSHASRTVGISANFLCDNSAYMLGAAVPKNDDSAEKAQNRIRRNVECFHACAEIHRKILRDVDTPAARAILSFFDRWQPENTEENPLLKPEWKAVGGGANLVFTRGSRPVTQDKELCAAWQRYYDQEDPDAQESQCLITGELADIAMTHPMIKGVQGAQSSGAALVSFNAAAFCSYGHTQNANAPVGKTAAFAYATALNTLLADWEHCRRVGDTTIVCWAEHGAHEYQEAWESGLWGEQEGMSDQDLWDALDKLSRGEPCDWKDVELQPEEHFYILGLSPNAARLSVRFFLRDSFGQIMKNVLRHYTDIKITRPVYDPVEYLPLWRLSSETTRDKDTSPQLFGDLLRAILTGGPYPATLLNGVHLRIRAEHEINRGRAAIIKGYYLRQQNPNIHKEVFTVELNEDSNYLPYVLGRLFYVLEEIQEKANPGLNTTIKDKYFNSASASPVTVFPLLVDLAQKHLRKIDKWQNYDRKLTNLLSRIHSEYPPRMTLAEQGAFQIGYYHQKQVRYTKKEDKENV